MNVFTFIRPGPISANNGGGYLKRSVYLLVAGLCKKLGLRADLAKIFEKS